ncbi:MAG: hypothetical protein ABI634_18270 [Acidobacteriota bacterium]
MLSAGGLAHARALLAGAASDDPAWFDGPTVQPAHAAGGVLAVAEIWMPGASDAAPAEALGIENADATTSETARATPPAHAAGATTETTVASVDGTQRGRPGGRRHG